MKTTEPTQTTAILEQRQDSMDSAEETAYRAIRFPESDSMTPFQCLHSAAAVAVGMAEQSARREAGSGEPVAVAVDRYIGGNKDHKLTYRRGPGQGAVEVAYTYPYGKKAADGHRPAVTTTFTLSSTGQATAIEPNLPEPMLGVLGDRAATNVIDAIRSKGQPTSHPTGPMARLAVRAGLANR